jgi:hypothetical protein
MAGVKTYPGPVEDAVEVIRFLRQELGNLRALRKVRISPEGTIIFDVNKDGLEFPGLTYGSAVLERLLQELGVMFSADTLHQRPGGSRGRKEFDLSARYTWGHDRVM